MFSFNVKWFHRNHLMSTLKRIQSLRNIGTWKLSSDALKTYVRNTWKEQNSCKMKKGQLSHYIMFSNEVNTQ